MAQRYGDRHQNMLFPQSIDDYITDDDPKSKRGQVVIRIIECFAVPFNGACLCRENHE